MRAYLVILCLLLVGIAGCGYKTKCQSDFEGPLRSWGNGTQEARAWTTICETRFEFDEESSRLIVVETANDTFEWKRYALDSQNPKDVHVAFGRDATIDDPRAPISFRKIASGHIEEDQFIGICGPSPMRIGISPEVWPGSWDGPTVNLRPCV
jgi:hypothetical protein